MPANINLMDMVIGMAERGITIEQVNTANEWALNCIEDVFTIYPEYHPQWTELKSRISERFRIYGNPPSSVPNDTSRIWVPPPSWNVHALFNDRKLSITQAGQASRKTFDPNNSRSQYLKRLSTSDSVSAQLSLDHDQVSPSNHETTSITSQSSQPNTSMHS
ncbi:hypothetical protein MPER_13138 [Moniliophthora perniciosa FA553]|nr:hypothetical protein MPER_13138 [Moniliophthora perniciosa FA553]